MAPGASHGLPHLLRGTGWIDFGDAQGAERIYYGVDYGRRRADRGALTHALDTKRVDGAGRDRTVEHKARQVRGGRNHVGCQVTAEQRPTVAIGDLFVEGLRDTLRQATVHFTLHEHGVENPATVVDRDVSAQSNRPGFGIDLNHGDVRSKREDHPRRLKEPGRLEAGLDVLGPRAAVGS